MQIINHFYYTVLDSSLIFIGSSKNQIYLQSLQLTEDISNSFFYFNMGFVKLYEMRDIILLKKFCDSKSVEVKQDDDTPSYFQWLKLKLQRRNKSKDRVIYQDNANISDTVYLVNETQKLVSVFNANFHDQIKVYMSIEPELTIIFSNALFVKSAISNFLYNSFSNVKRKIRFNRNDTQEIIVFTRIVNTTERNSFTSKKLIRIDFIDTGTIEKNKAKHFPSSIWNQVNSITFNSFHN